MKKGGNAVEATRKQPLGRASRKSIGCRPLEVKGVIAWWARVGAASRKRPNKVMQTAGRFRGRR